MLKESGVPQLEIPKDRNNQLVSVNASGPFLGRRVGLAQKSAGSLDKAPWVSGKLTSFYKRTIASGSLDTNTADLVVAKLGVIKDRNGEARANSILDLGRNVVLVEGRRLDDQSVDKIFHLAFSLLKDPSWEVRMDAFWLIDVLREGGYLDDFDLDVFEKELNFRYCSGKENDPRVVENVRKLFSNLRIQRYGNIELENKRALSDYNRLRDELNKASEEKSRLKKENDDLVQKCEGQARENTRVSQLVDHLGSGKKALQKTLVKANEDNADLEKKSNVQILELRNAMAKRESEMQQVIARLEEIKAEQGRETEGLRKAVSQSKEELAEESSKRKALAEKVLEISQKNQEQAQTILEQMGSLERLNTEFSSLQGALKKTENELQTKKQDLENQEKRHVLALEEQREQTEGLQKIVSQSREELAEESSKRETLTKTVLEILQKNQEQAETILEQMESLRQLDSEFKNLQETLKKAESELQAKRQDLENQEKRNVQALKEERSAYEQELKRLSDQLQKKSAAVEELMSLTQKNLEQMKSLHSFLGDFDAKFNVVVAHNEALLQQIENGKIIQEVLEEELVKQRKVNGELEERKSFLEIENTMLKTPRVRKPSNSQENSTKAPKSDVPKAKASVVPAAPVAPQDKGLSFVDIFGFGVDFQA